LEGECEKHPACARSATGACNVAPARARCVHRSCRVARARRIARARYIGNHVQMGWMKERQLFIITSSFLIRNLLDATAAGLFDNLSG
jgi:hypothetical protein